MSGRDEGPATEIRRDAHSARRALERLMGAAAVFAEDTRTGTPSAAVRRRHLARIAKLAGRIACDLDGIRLNARTIAKGVTP